jgi:hypothetical protein
MRRENSQPVGREILCHPNRVKIDYLWRFTMPINCAVYRDEIVRIGDFSSVFVEKISIHKDFDKRINCSPRYDRQFFLKNHD